MENEVERDNSQVHLTNSFKTRLRPLEYMNDILIKHCMHGVVTMVQVTSRDFHRAIYTSITKHPIKLSQPAGIWNL